MGHKEVKYSEMAAPPRLILKGEDLLVMTENSKEYPSFFIYEVLSEIDKGSKCVLLNGNEAMYRDLKKEYRVSVKSIKDSLFAYKFFWLDPDKKRTQLTLEYDSVR